MPSLRARQVGIEAPDALARQVHVEVGSPTTFRSDTQERVRQSRAQTGHGWLALLLQRVILYRFDSTHNAGRPRILRRTTLAVMPSERQARGRDGAVPR